MKVTFISSYSIVIYRRRRHHHHHHPCRLFKMRTRCKIEIHLNRCHKLLFYCQIVEQIRIDCSYKRFPIVTFTVQQVSLIGHIKL